MTKRYIVLRMAALCATILLCLLWTTPGLALVPRNVAVISNSGSTNTIGYRIYVALNGTVHYVDGHGSGQGTLSPNLTQRFFYDIMVANPLSSLPEKQTCIKSVSLGTSTYLAFDSETSPDLSCPASDPAQDLKNDVHRIARVLNITTVLTSEGTPLPPVNF